MATVQRYVDTGSSGGDGTTAATSGSAAAYAGLSSWEANVSGVNTDDFIVDCAATDTGSGNLADSTGVNINFISLTTGTLIIQTTGTARNNSSAFIDATKYRLIVNGACLIPNTQNMTLRGIQIDCTSTGSFTSAIHLNSANSNGMVVERSRIRSSARACIGTNGSTGTFGTAVIRNNIFVLSAGSAALDIAPTTTQNGVVDWKIYHNTIYTNGSKPGLRISGFSGASSQLFDIKNNIAANTSDPFTLLSDTGSLTTVTDYNWTDAGTDGTTNEQNLSGSQFTSAGTTFAADFSLTEALATGGAVGSITDDIVGTTRGSPPDAGAFELDDGGGSASYSYTGSGGITLSGAALLAKTRQYLASGGLTLAGAAEVEKSRQYEGSGGLTFSGAATTTQGEGAASHSYIGSGGIIFAGEAELEKSRQYMGSGGLSFGGAATTIFTSAVQSTIGGIVPYPRRRRR